MPLTVFDTKGIPATRRERIEAAVVAGGKHVAAPHEAWISSDPFRNGVRVLIIEPHGFQRTVTLVVRRRGCANQHRRREPCRARSPPTFFRGLRSFLTGCRNFGFVVHDLQAPKNMEVRQWHNICGGTAFILQVVFGFLSFRFAPAGRWAGSGQGHVSAITTPSNISKLGGYT